MLMSYIILVYYILITPIFYYFSRLTIELFFREGCKNNMLEFIYDKCSSEYDIRFVGTFYYFRLDKLYSEYIYNIYQRDMFTEKVNVIESLINKCDIIYDFNSHLKYERRYYIEIYYSILLLGILFLLIFFLS